VRWHLTVPGDQNRPGRSERHAWIPRLHDDADAQRSVRLAHGEAGDAQAQPGEYLSGGEKVLDGE
jgi:hypothetical protein